MYTKNLSEDLRLRLSTEDMDFLRELSTKRSVSVSECIRSILSEYRRSIDTLKLMNDAIALMKSKEALSNGDTKTDFHDFVQH